eukprot:c13859_g1_i1.p1 GENE.c13859_g1_i1~~c13859_g1_i1.p1  ORF type:complete len:410 (+),score=175.36 c13859_g1_i1:114-1232(+)
MHEKNIKAKENENKRLIQESNENVKKLINAILDAEKELNFCYNEQRKLKYRMHLLQNQIYVHLRTNDSLTFAFSQYPNEEISEFDNEEENEEREKIITKQQENELNESNKKSPLKQFSFPQKRKTLKLKKQNSLPLMRGGGIGGINNYFDEYYEEDFEVKMVDKTPPAILAMRKMYSSLSYTNEKGTEISDLVIVDLLGAHLEHLQNIGTEIKSALKKIAAQLALVVTSREESLNVIKSHIRNKTLPSPVLSSVESETNSKWKLSSFSTVPNKSNSSEKEVQEISDNNNNSSKENYESKIKQTGVELLVQIDEIKREIEKKNEGLTALGLDVEKAMKDYEHLIVEQRETMLMIQQRLANVMGHLHELREDVF